MTAPPEFSFSFVNLNEIPKIQSGAKVTRHKGRHVKYAFGTGTAGTGLDMHLGLQESEASKNF